MPKISSDWGKDEMCELSNMNRTWSERELHTKTGRCMDGVDVRLAWSEQCRWLGYSKVILHFLFYLDARFIISILSWEMFLNLYAYKEYMQYTLVSLLSYFIVSSYFPFRIYRQGDVHISFLSLPMSMCTPYSRLIFTNTSGTTSDFFSSGLYVAIRFQLLSSPLLCPLLQKISSKMLT